MTGSGVSDARVCPECGTRNSGLSLFCAECGAPLYRYPSPSDETQATAAIPAAPDSTTTAEFSPRPDATQETMTSGPVWGAPAMTPEPPPPSVVSPPAMISTYPPESSRGLVLGWIASILIVLAIAFVVWAVLLSPGTRDTISGWFSWIG